ncbi:MAG: hypothetical protein EAZ11_06690 [Curvibacter sp.]|nr:MAG: hypothetical protein EAZ11_06690 [Curvibacter sp.]
MIAANYLKHPESLRFQRELFHNGFKNSPRIMRAMECIFKFSPDVPQWAKDMARKARQLVQAWKKAQVSCNFSEPVKAMVLPAGFYRGPNGETWSGRGLVPKWLQQLVSWGHSKEEFKVAERTEFPAHMCNADIWKFLEQKH